MKTVFITRSQAVALLSAFLSPKDAEEEVRDSVQSAIFRDAGQWCVSEGCKLGFKRQGAVVRAYLSGYAPDGSDVDKVLKSIPEYGWTVIRRDSATCGFHVYKRDCPADYDHYAADLAPFTFPTKAEAIAQGRLGNYAYKIVKTPGTMSDNRTRDPESPPL